MRVTLRMRLAARTGRKRRAVAIGVAVLLAGGLAAAVTQVAAAQPQPNIDQVRATINTLTGEFNKANQQYDQVEEQLDTADARLRQLNGQLASDQARYESARQLVVQIADSSYEDSASTSLAGLLTSNDPRQVLAEASIVMQITGTRNLETQAFLGIATQLAAVQQEQQHTEQGIAQLATQRKDTKDHISSLLAKQNSILNSLTGTELAAVQQGTVNSGGGITDAVYTGPTGSQADSAVAFVFKQLGCAYVYGATGPNSWDCSGLMQWAYAQAGVAIGRTTYQQIDAGTPVASTADLQVGDLVFFNDDSHVGMYAGGGMILHAPHTGTVVKFEKMSEIGSIYAMRHL